MSVGDTTSLSWEWEDEPPPPLITEPFLYLFGVLRGFTEHQVTQAMAVDGVVPEVVDKRPSSSEGLYINSGNVIRYPDVAAATKAHAIWYCTASLTIDTSLLHTHVHTRRLVSNEDAERTIPVPSAAALYDVVCKFGPIAEVDLRQDPYPEEDEVSWRANVQFWRAEDAAAFDDAWGRGMSFEGWHVTCTVLDDSRTWPHALRVKRGLSPERNE